MFNWLFAVWRNRPSDAICRWDTWNRRPVFILTFIAGVLLFPFARSRHPEIETSTLLFVFYLPTFLFFNLAFHIFRNKIELSDLYFGEREVAIGIASLNMAYLFTAFELLILSQVQTI